MNLPRHDHWINGRATPPYAGDYLPTHDPMTTRGPAPTTGAAQRRADLGV